MAEQSSESTGNGSAIQGGLAVFLALIAVSVASYPAYELYRRGADEDSVSEKVKQRRINYRIPKKSKIIKCPR